MDTQMQIAHRDVFSNNIQIFIIQMTRRQCTVCQLLSAPRLLIEKTLATNMGYMHIVFYVINLLSIY